MHYTCIACITIDSIMKMNKKNYPQVNLEECKHRVKKTQMSRLINAEIESNSDSDSDSDLDLDSELKSLKISYSYFTHTLLLTLNKSFYY